MPPSIWLPVGLSFAAMLAGCAEPSLTFQCVDADTGRPLAGVRCERTDYADRYFGLSAEYPVTEYAPTSLNGVVRTGQLPTGKVRVKYFVFALKGYQSAWAECHSSRFFIFVHEQLSHHGDTFVVNPHEQPIRVPMHRLESGAGPPCAGLRIETVRG